MRYVTGERSACDHSKQAIVPDRVSSAWPNNAPAFYWPLGIIHVSGFGDISVFTEHAQKCILYDMSAKVHPGAVAAAVGITVLASLIFMLRTCSIAEDNYRAAHWQYQPSHEVTIDEMGRHEMLVKVYLPSLAFLLIYPFIGRAISWMTHALAGVADRLYQTDIFSDWPPELSILVGALWPISLLGLVFFAVADVIGYLYFSLWP